MRRICVLFLLITFSLQGFAQVTIGSSASPAEQALLDLKEFDDGTANRGLLLPRVALSATTLPNPLTEFIAGLVVYNTTTSEDEDVEGSIVTPGFYYCDGSRWVQLKPAEEIHIPAEPWKDARSGEGATSNTQNIYQNAQVGIGKAGAINPSAQLEVSSDDKGFLLPRLDTRQRDEIKNPEPSLLIWNTDENCFNFWKNNKWRSMCGDAGESVIKITPVDCAAAVVRGTYKVGEPTNNSNYIDLTIEVIEPGTYVIEGQTHAGFFFQKSGVFTVAGTYDIQLPAMGTPNKSGTLNFELTLNGIPFAPSCAKTVEVAAAGVQFTFDPSYCGVKTYSDQLAAGESTSGKTIKVKVNVVNPGLFTFSTNTVFGVQYTANNVNLVAGSHVITLYANGNPPTGVGENIAFTVSGRGQVGNDCQVLVDIIQNKATAVVDCGTATVNGIYKLEVATTGANYISVPVNFTSVGIWTGKATNDVAGFSFSGEGAVSATGAQVVRLYAKGTPVSAGTKEFKISINGVECTIDVLVIPPIKKILSIGHVSANIENSLKSSANFGPNGTSKVEEIQIIRAESNPTAAQLIEHINQNGVEIIIAGWYFDASNEAANVIADFIRNKKGYFFQVQSQDQQPYLKRILDKAYYDYNVNVEFTPDELTIYSGKLSNEDLPFLNGVFGDARGKYIRGDDRPSWIGMVPSTEKTPPFGSLAHFPANGSEVERNMFTYAPGYFMISDWGSLHYSHPQYGTHDPIGFSTQAFNGYYGWDGVSYGKPNIAAGETANWVVFGNAMDYIFQYVEEHTDKTYQVSQSYVK